MFVKICGITRPDDAVAAAAAGADAIGLNFVPDSRRCLDRADARAILAVTPPHVMTVGIFRDHSAEEILEITGDLGLHGAQLHGPRTPEATAQVAAGVQTLIVATTVEDVLRGAVEEHPTAIVMLDGPTPGSGVPFDWSTVGRLVAEHRILLAGGLRPDTVADAVRQVRPWGVDVATGVETSPGIKNPDAIARFVTQARAAATRS